MPSAYSPVAVAFSLSTATTTSLILAGRRGTRLLLRRGGTPRAYSVMLVDNKRTKEGLEMTIDPKQLLSIKDLSALMGVSEQTVRNWIKEGKIEHYRIGGRIKIHPDQVDALVQKQPRN